MAEVFEFKTSLPHFERDAKAAEEALNKVLATIPNLPLDEVPDGADETGNVEHHRFGAKRDYAFKPKQHFELGEALGLMDFEIAAKLIRRAVCGAEGRAGADGARARAVHARCAYGRAWLHRGQSAIDGAR